MSASENEETPSMKEIRDELAKCVNLIQEGSPIAAATMLTKLKWRLEQPTNPWPEDAATNTKKGKIRPIYAWEHEQSLHPVNRDH